MIEIPTTFRGKGRTWRVALLAVIGLFPAHALQAQNSPSSIDNLVVEREPVVADRIEIDLFSPSGPAWVALGESPRRAADPGALRDFKFDFGSVREGERNRPGAAFSLLPYWLGDRRLTLTEYREEKGRLERMAARTQTSIGVAKAGGGDNDGLRLSAAIQTQLFDRQDYRYDDTAFKCISDAFVVRRQVYQSAADEIAQRAAAGENLTPDDLVAIQKRHEQGGSASSDLYKEARKKCQNVAARRLLEEPSWKVGLGVGARSGEDELASFDYDGVSLWSSFRQPIDRRGRFAALTYVRGDIGRVFDFDNDLFAEGDGVVGGVGLAYQSPKFRIDLSVDHNHRSFSTGTFDDDQFQRYTSVVDFRVRDGIWVEVAGGTIVNSDLVNGPFWSANLKIAWGEFLPFGG